ncbi:NUDIX hydrolase [Abyssisolibacter fermentans]|uniref:NUDIX hydrolase n=1 Tax=Abyssisolibacter fermentans TaxID=1766203 RepID=UPI0008378A08|nr:NUDIX domain-containing protein [Abyssisolibacter fermentans]
MENNKKIEFSVKAIIIDKDKFLIMHKKRVKEELWDLPGGRMEFSETAQDTLLREVQEETGLRVKPFRLLDTWNVVYENRQITGIIYLCKLEKGEIRLSDEHDKYKWVDASIESIDCLYESFKERMKNWNFNKLLDD